MGGHPAQQSEKSPVSYTHLMYITVTMKEVDELVACGVDILAVQGLSLIHI